MASLHREERVRRLIDALPKLSDTIFAWIERVLAETSTPGSYRRNSTSDLVDERFLADFGDTLRLHHCFSNEPFSKDKFEYAVEWVAKACGHTAQLAPRGNPGHDITIDGTRISLKTQANKGIKLSWHRVLPRPLLRPARERPRRHPRFPGLPALAHRAPEGPRGRARRGATANDLRVADGDEH